MVKCSVTMGQKSDCLSENRIPWELHVFPLILAVAATGYALLNYTSLPDAIGVYLPFRRPAQIFIARLVVVAVYLGVIWTLQAISIRQTRRWIAREVKKRLNIRYIILASAVVYFSILTCIGVSDALYKGAIFIGIPFLDMIAMLSIILPLISERQRLFIPNDIPPEFPGELELPYIERSHKLEWALLLICLSALPVILLSVVTKVSIILLSPGLVVTVLLYRVFPPSLTEWHINDHIIFYKAKHGAKTVVQKDWHINEINFVEALNFDPEKDFDDYEPRYGKHGAFDGVQGYFDDKCRRGVVIGTRNGEFFLLGFERPNYAAALINRVRE